MAIIKTGLSTPGLKSEFFRSFEEVSTIWQDLCTVVKSDKDKETYGWIGSVPSLREWGDGRLARGMFSESYSVKNMKYESSLEVDRDEISDDQTGQIRQRVRQLAQRAAEHKDALLADLIINGASAGFNGYDGVPFFSATHAMGKSGTQSNLVGASATDPNAPTAAEIRTAMKAAISKLMSFKDSQGEPVNQNGMGLVAIVPPANYIEFLEAFQSALISTGGTNVLANAAKVVTFARLSNAAKWYLLKTEGVALRPFILQDREPIEFGALEKDSDEGFLREKFIFGVRARYRLTYGEWARALEVTFS